MADGQPDPEDIMKAVRASGYLMEQEVATTIEKQGFQVRPNTAFEDMDEGKSREIDVVATRRYAADERDKIGATAQLIVECKNTVTPYVFITRPKDKVDFLAVPEEFCFPFEYRMEKKLTDGRTQFWTFPAFRHLGFNRLLPATSTPWKAVQFCGVRRKSGAKGEEAENDRAKAGSAKWYANHDGMYDAMFYPMAKALKAHKELMPRYQTPTDWAYMWFFFPLIVTSGPLFMIDSSAADPHPVSVPFITFGREIQTSKLSGKFLVTFIQQASLPQYFGEVIEPIMGKAVELLNPQNPQYRTTTLPWREDFRDVYGTP
ncbi:hypothetical protein ACSBOB_20075 [Mesorhizobium sp. ASY16-5R]|uniref:hypothetical protein n=1 Tax=Mesorhizobium sp. ASY16-5R TaxID=3445772 RepID=UPI003FA0E8D2